MSSSIGDGSTPVTLGGYMSGAWYNPSQSGHGFDIEATGQIESVTNLPIMLAFWYVYSPDGKSQNWIYAEGTYDTTKNTVTLPAVLVTGGKFPFPLSNFDANSVKHTPWGTVTFTFSGCNKGTASWTSTVAGYGHGSMPIHRLTSIAGTGCP